MATLRRGELTEVVAWLREVALDIFRERQPDDWDPNDGIDEPFTEAEYESMVEAVLSRISDGRAKVGGEWIELQVADVVLDDDPDSPTFEQQITLYERKG